MMLLENLPVFFRARLDVDFEVLKEMPGTVTSLYFFTLSENIAWEVSFGGLLVFSLLTTTLELTI
jgi:hypothetical protein